MTGKASVEKFGIKRNNDVYYPKTHVYEYPICREDLSVIYFLYQEHRTKCKLK